jgi:hypothetical protein
LILSVSLFFYRKQESAQSSGGGTITLHLWHIYADENQGVPIEAASL